jgi:hypothetical protein
MLNFTHESRSGVQMKTCVERCAQEFENDLEGIFGRVVTRAECERLALDCDPCNPQFCVVAQVLKRQLGADQAAGA